jgi:magnesium chelatase subunit D
MQPAFPFSAIVGQPALKRALLLGVIQPNLGGVLVRGTKGVAKSTAVRALAALLPPLETVAGCPFQRRPGEIIEAWPLPDAPTVVRPVPLVELPLGATEDRVLGALHLERALRGERAFEPGLLASANRGLLCIDEVNLLPDHLVDLLLDAAASGVHRVEREGLSLQHPARFLLVGTMNPEEGELRPQLLDRFGLMVDVADLADAAERAEVVRRRLAFEAAPDAFMARWKEADAAEAARVVRARELLNEVQIPDDLLAEVAQRCQAAHVEGLRADLTLCRAAAAWAAYQGRRQVEVADLDAVAELALAHRRKAPPEPPPDRPPFRRPGDSRPQSSSANGKNTPAPATEQTLRSEGSYTVQARPTQPPGASPLSGRSGQGPSSRSRSGGPVLAWTSRQQRIDWAATLRQAARQRTGQLLPLRVDDLRAYPRHGPVGRLIVLLLDASGSMAAWQRMRTTKAAVIALLRQAYQTRDQVSIVTFGGPRGAGFQPARTSDRLEAYPTGNARLLLPPTRRPDRAIAALEALPVGGATPLAHGLDLVRRLVRAQRRKQPRLPAWVVVLTDGRANVPFGHSSAGAWPDALVQARALASNGVEALVVDTDTAWPHLGKAAELAAALGAACRPLNDILTAAPLLRPA